MASTPITRNSNILSRPTSTPTTNPRPHIAEGAARLIAERAAANASVAIRPVRLVLPRVLYVEPADLEKYVNDDPLFGTRGAAIILGVSVDLIKKWRERGQGPDYYQFEQSGPVRYSLKALNAYKAAHLIVTPHKRGRK
jgi:hypothetical protein